MYNNIPHLNVTLLNNNNNNDKYYLKNVFNVYNDVLNDCFNKLVNFKSELKKINDKFNKEKSNLIKYFNDIISVSTNNNNNNNIDKNDLNLNDDKPKIRVKSLNELVNNSDNEDEVICDGVYQGMFFISVLRFIVFI